MQQIFVELYNYRPAWAKCSESARTDFAKKIVEAVKGLKSAGVDVVVGPPQMDRRFSSFRFGQPFRNALKNNEVFLTQTIP
jgi:hypothetical protein